MTGAAQDWEGCLNARDVGGLPITGGGRTACNSLFRADSLGHLTTAGIDAVRRCGVSRIVDLRYAGEGLPDAAHAAPHPFGGEEAYRAIPMFDPRVRGLDPELLLNGSTGEIYCASVDVNAKRIVAAISAIAAAPPGAVLVHCVAGKDRTGIVVALVLAAIGVEHQAIAEDYAASAEHLASRFAYELASEPDSFRRKLLQRRHATDPETMLTLLQHLDQRYGGATSYCSLHDVNDDLLSALRTRLIESA